MKQSEAEQLKEYEQEVEAEVMAQVKQDDPVLRDMRYRCFVSRSKGRGRQRRRVKEVELVQYRHLAPQWSLYNRFPWDKYAAEILGEGTEYPAQVLMDRVRDLPRFHGKIREHYQEY